MSKRFRSQDYFRYKKFGTRWRRPRGRQSKLRIEKKGSGLQPKIGYGKRKMERGITVLHAGGKDKFFRPVLVKSLGDLDKIARDMEAALIASGVGSKKVILIKTKAKELGITILNMKKVRKAEKKSYLLSKKSKVSEEEKEKSKKHGDEKKKHDKDKSEKKQEKEEVKEKHLKKEKANDEDVLPILPEEVKKDADVSAILPEKAKKKEEAEKKEPKSAEKNE